MVANNLSLANKSLSPCDMNDSSDYVTPLDMKGMGALFISLYSVVFVCAFLGNILVIIVVLKHRRMRTITNFFLANLAVADLAVGIFCVLPNLSINISQKWFLGRTMCKLCYFVQAMSYTASITILTVISIERYVAIIYPLRAKQLTTMCLLRVIVLLIWLISAASGIPYLIVYDQVSLPVIGCGSNEADVMHFCMVVHDIHMQAYITSNFLIWFVVPLCFMTVLYVHISVVLWKSSGAQKGLRTHNPRQLLAYSAVSNKSSGQPETWTHCNGPRKNSPLAMEPSHDFDECEWPSKVKPTQLQHQHESHELNPTSNRNSLKSRGNGKSNHRATHKHENALLARRKVIRLLIAVLLSFTICVLPYHVRMLWQSWSEPELNYWQRLLPPIVFVIFYLNSALNPLLYAFLSDKFRQSLIEVVTCKVRKRANFSLKTIASTA